MTHISSAIPVNSQSIHQTSNLELGNLETEDELELELELDCKSWPVIDSVADSQELAECGWRIEIIQSAEGHETYLKIPLTEEEFLHPKEDYRLPNSVFHASISRQVVGLLTQRYATEPEVRIFQDLIVEWDDPNLKDNCPDVMVVFGLQTEPSPDKTRLIVAKEGVRPAFILEVVSPRYRKADRKIKVTQYETAKVQEYVIVDRRKRRGKVIREVIGYRLQSGQYEAILPDDQGRILCETIGVFMSLNNEQIILEDAVTGLRLKTTQEWKEEAEQEHQRAEQEHQRAEELKALLARYQQQFGDLA
jgi:Uma2 family endonuclease